MNTSVRGWLATVLASGLLAACSSEGNGPPPADAGSDIGMTDVAPTDRPRADRPVPVDRGNLAAAACGAAMDLAGRTPGADGTVRVMGDNSTGAAVEIGNLGRIAMGGCVNAAMGGKGMVLVYRYTMRTAGTLVASTANAGTDDPMFDTIVAVLGTCSATATPLACNDDLGPAAAMTHRLHSTATTQALTMGQTVFVVVGGYGASAKEASTGAFELSLREAPPIAVGMPCRVGEVCATGSICVGAAAMNSGLCTADGTAPGAACRLAAPACDGDLTCSVMTPSMASRGICRRPAAPGEVCGPTATCTMMGFCPAFATPVAPAGDAGVSADGGAPSGMTARVCTLPVMEAEPNNTPAAPQAAVTRTTVFRGALMPGSDVDCYAVTVPTGATLFAQTSDGQGGCDLPEEGDTVLRAYREGAATPVAENDDLAMGVVCSRIDGRTSSGSALLRVAGGTYTFCVSPFVPMGETMGGAIPVYYLTVGITPPAP